MHNHQKAKNIHSQQQQQQQPQPQSGPPSYPNQQSRPNTYHFDDASQKFGYGGPYVGGTGAGQVPPRLPLVSGLQGPTQPIAAPNSSVGGMPQGPPPGNFVGHSPLDLSKQTPPHHQSAHHSLPPASLGVNQQLAMANPGHSGPMQGRPTQGNNQFFGRQIRPGNQHMPRPPMAGGTINPNHPPNAPQALPYPGMNQPLLFVIGDQFSQQSPYLSYPANPPAYYPQSGNLPPGNVSFQQPRAAQQTYGYRQTPPYPTFPMQSTPAVFYQQQQPQPQQPQQQPQQPQQPQQVPVAPPPTAQPRESSGSSRRARSSALRIVDPNTNRDVLTGEEVLVSTSVVVTPTTATPPEIVAPGVAAAPVAAVDEVEAPLTVTAPVTSETEEMAPTPKEEAVVVTPPDNTNVEVIEEVKAEEKTVPTVAAVPVVVAAPPAPTPPVPATVAAPVVATPPAPVIEKEVITVPVTQENGEVPSPSEPPSSSASPTPASTSVSPEQGEGRGNPKGGKKGRKSSRTGSTPTPPTPTPPPPQSIEEVKIVAQPVATVAEIPAPIPVKDVEPVAAPIASAVVPTTQAPVIDSSPKVEIEIKDTPKPLPVVPESDVEKPSEKPVIAVETEPVITNGDKQGSSPSPSVIVMTPPPITASDDGENRAPGKSSSLKYTYKDDQWSPVNPEGKKTYDRNFLLELQNNPASQKKPDGLPSLEVVRDKASTMKRGVSVGDFTPPFVKMMPAKGLPKRNSQQGSRDQGMGQQQPPQRREIKLMNSLVRQERPEDPNVWKPKHASKTKEEKENPDKASTEGMLKTVRGILNKLTPSKFEALLARIQALDIDSEDRLAGVIKLFFEKAVDEPIFSSMYAKMCQALSTKEVASAANPAETTNFRKLLLTRCQKEFEKDSAGLVDVENKKKEIETAETEAKKKELELELEDLVNSNRRKSLGNIRFIGELFKLRILSVKIMHQCILRLLSQPEDEESLECLCRLLSTIGKELETPMQVPAGRSTSISTNRETMNSYFSTLDGIVNKRKISNRIRFMIQDVVDLRKTGWKPRREDNNPKTIDQIHREVHKEREEQERELNNPQFQGPMGSMGGLSRDGRMGDRRGGDDRNRKQSRPSDDGWNTVQNSGNRGGNVKLDMKQLRIPKASGDADQAVISLGPGGKGMTSWGRGASGGMSQSMIGGVGGGASQDTRSNRYQILEDDSGTQHESGKAPFAGRSSLGGPPQSGRGGNQDYRTMPGATKSAFFPPKDGDRGLDPLRSQNSGFSGRSRSQQSSRENSVTRPVIRETAQPPALSREVSKDVLLGKSTVTDDEIERKSHSLLGEYFTNEKIEDAVLDMKEWLHPSTIARFINQCLLHVLEHNKKERRATGTLLKEMVKRKLFNSSDIMEGFTELLQSAEDFIVDIPKLWEYVAELVEPLFEEGVINLNFLPQLSSTLNSSLVANFVAAVLKELVKAQGVAGAERIFIMSNAPLTSVLPSGVDLNAFLAQHKELEFLSKVDSIPRGSGSVGKSSSSATPASQVNIDFQHSLEKYLRDATQLTTDDVCSWIQKQYVGEVNPAFIRALVTAVTESSIEGRGTDSKLNNTVLKNRTEVLRRYVDNIADRELQLLYAVQTLVTQRQHPKGLIQGIFETLYDSNVVSEEGFESWVSADDPLEREGKAVALKMITSFLTWLKEADPESDQEADA
ncbi:eukaryotic translation initiation factor 4 gamma 1-like isoform X2 [Daphnia pulex]|uniref:eukaryotic translation initiation factor 4 gamma 1-like isoform X2 n=1 Tax=Daphnia pulex TaxID=6669 RepID=UPI001EDF2049|nr:eukaryotic translation initiation factor 4 gamma 1-like isoform X2 [Daphnia pulex]